MLSGKQAGINNSGGSVIYFFGISKGIKWRMVDLAKIIHFYFRKNA